LRWLLLLLRGLHILAIISGCNEAWCCRSSQIYIELSPSHPVADKPITLFKVSSVPPSSAEPSNSSGPLPPTQTSPPGTVSSFVISPHRHHRWSATSGACMEKAIATVRFIIFPLLAILVSPRQGQVTRSHLQWPGIFDDCLVLRTFHQGRSILSQIIAKGSKDL
jgi:hypothetical protein